MTSWTKLLRLFAFAVFLSYIVSQSYFVVFSEDKTEKSDIAISAKSAILIDAITGQILYQKNPYLKCYPASTTKILTALVALSKENDLHKIFKVSKKATLIEPGSSSFYLTEGESISFIDALYAMLLVSANDAANVIAENIDQSIESFVEDMNKYAQSIGAYDSHFVNPNGLHNNEHYVTAFDLSLIAKKAYMNPIIKKIVSTVEYKVTSATLHTKPESQLIFNINKLIRKNSKYYYSYANGMKTGYTTQAKRTLIASAKKDDIELIAIILSSDDAFKDAITLFDFGFSNFKKEELFKANQRIGKLNIDKNNNNSFVDTYIKYPFYILSCKDKPTFVTYNVEYKNDINLPLKKDTVVGNVYLYSYDHLISTLPILSLEDYKPTINVKRSIRSIEHRIIPLIKWAIIIAIIIVILLILFLILTCINLKKKRSKLKLKSTKTIDFSSLTKKVK